LAIAAEIGIGVARISRIAAAVLSRSVREVVETHRVQVGTLLATSLAPNAFNVVARWTAWLYLVALVCGMLVTFMQFISLVRSVWELVDGRSG